MDSLTVVISSNLPMVWSALCATGTAQGLGAVHVPRDGGLATVVGVTAPTVLTIDLLDVPTVDLRGEVTVVCRELSDACRRPGVLLVADCIDELGTVELLRCGVRGVFTPDTPLDLFPKAVRSIAEDEVWWTRRQISAALEELALPDSGESAEELRLGITVTPREVSVLELMAQGRNHLEIAEILGFSPHTARTHIRNVMRKLDVHSRTEAVQVALRAGLIDQTGGSAEQG